MTTIAVDKTRRRPGRLVAIWFLAPAVLLISITLIAPFIDTVYRSFFIDDGFVRQWTGLTNYINLLQSPAFGRSLLNTFMWVIGTLLLPVCLGLFVAAGTWQLPLGGILRFSLILPYAISGAATAVLWTFMLQSDGVLNSILESLSLEPQPWLLEWPMNTVMMILASTWQGTGASVILFLVGLQAIPQSTIDAALLDGAEGWRKFWYVILPQLQPIIIVVVGINIVNSLKTFDIILLLTNGGPGFASETLALTMYRETFTLSRYGAGAAVAVVLTIVVVLASWLYLQRQLKAQP